MKIYKLTQNFGSFGGYLIYVASDYSHKKFGELSDYHQEINAFCISKSLIDAEIILLALAALSRIAEPDQEFCQCYRREGHTHGIISTVCKRCDFPL